VEHPDGTSSRLDQVCLDVAPARYEVEKSFWTALTGWNLHAGTRGGRSWTLAPLPFMRGRARPPRSMIISGTVRVGGSLG
jgi:hypothetical protein